MCEGCEERIHVGHQVHRIDRSISKLLEMRVKEEGLDEIALMHGWILRYPVSYTHLDVYKRQPRGCMGNNWYGRTSDNGKLEYGRWKRSQLGDERSLCCTDRIQCRQCDCCRPDRRDCEL